ncbi:TPA: hypothetical protein ACKE3B_000050 [Clostridioides difficile]|nr:hypothetical protein [Clostridioides difficile]
MFKEYLIRELKEDDIKNALDLIWNVFEELNLQIIVMKELRHFINL